MAASWPCFTAQMMFFGPNAASPPKNTPGRVDWNVIWSITGTSWRSNPIAKSRSIQGGNHAGTIFRWMGGDTSQLSPELEARLAGRPPVPTTSIYSKSDGERRTVTLTRAK